MTVLPVTLEGRYVRLRPMSPADAAALVDAAGEGELWNSTLTLIPGPASIDRYIADTLEAQTGGTELPFVIIRKTDGKVVGSTRFYGIERTHRRLEIGYTWLARAAQRTPVNTEAKLLLLTHAFEVLQAVRVGFVTDVLNEQSRNAILRLGAREEGIMRNHMIMPDGRTRDSIFFSMVDSEWPGIKRDLLSKLAR